MECKVLNVYQVNTWKNLHFMHKVNSNTTPTTNLTSPLIIIQKISAKANYSVPAFKSKQSKYWI